jgi:Mrp family chromosome partitioning ATPase
MVNKKVLIIDSNFSNNSLTRNFKASGGPLEEFTVSGPVSDFKSFRYAINPTHIKSVDIIGCKGGNYTPDEILGKDNLLAHLNVLGQHYDYILLEGAALNDNSDTKELSRYADGILAIFATDSVINQLDKESIHFLLNEKQKFIGGILNKVDKENIDI